jgi:hypothetical protein
MICKQLHEGEIMIRSNLIIAAVLGGALVIGCEKKEETATPARTTPATPAAPATPDLTTPATPTTQGVKDSLKSGAASATDAARSATQSVGAGIRSGATTRPAGLP